VVWCSAAFSGLKVVCWFLGQWHSSGYVGLTNLGSESETCVGSRVRLVGVSISFEKNFYRLPFTPPPSLVRRIGPSLGYILGYIHLHIGPPETLFQILVHLGTAGMNRKFGLVSLV
jgi:hypothetical protein